MKKILFPQLLILVLSAQLAPAQTELIINGGFESGYGSWTQVGSLYVGVGFPNPHSGSSYAYFGVGSDGITPLYNASGSLYQSLTVPSTTSATLTFWLYATSDETGSGQYDKLYVEILNSSGSLLETKAIYSNLDKSSSYTQKSFSVTSYAGQTIRLQFRGTSDASIKTVFRIDDVSISATATNLPAPTLTSIVQKCDRTTPGIEIQWTAVTGASNYEIYRNSSLIYTTVTAGTIFWNTSGLTAGQSYSYQVKAKSSSTTSSLSNSLSASAPNCAQPTLSVSPSSVMQNSGGLFSFSGDNYTPNGTVYRFIRYSGQSSYTQISNWTANSSGQISWTFSPTCTDPPVGTDTLYVADATSGKQSNTVDETVTSNPSCTADNPPNVTAFSVGTVSNTVTISYAVTDDIGLTRVELWRTIDSSGSPKGSTWTQPQTTTLSNQKGYSGSFTDVPTSSGTYWYGIHIVDSKGQWTTEKDAGLGPTKVIIIISPISNGFDYPIGSNTYYTEGSDGDGWYDAQDFGEFNFDVGKYHLGEDWNIETGGNNDCGLPVYSISEGTIVYSGTASGWGKVLIVRHTLSDGSQVESLYGHLQTFSVTTGSVTRRQQIGTIGNGDGAVTYCHLHFEIRFSNCPNWGLSGPGYSTTSKPTGWTDPSDFIDAHLPGVSNPTAQQISDYSDQLALTYKVPAIIIKAVLEQESGWLQFNADGSTVFHEEKDRNGNVVKIGYGLMQITVPVNTASVAMMLGTTTEGIPQGSNDFTSGYESVDVSVDRLKNDWHYNLETGTRILLAKKCAPPSAGGSGGANDDCKILENWYYPLAYYNGAVEYTGQSDYGSTLGNDPSFNYPRIAGDWKNKANFPYQECIYNIVAGHSVPVDRLSYFGSPIKVTLPGPSAVGTGAGNYSYVEPVFCFWDWATFFNDGTVHTGKWGTSSGCISTANTRTNVQFHTVALPVELSSFTAVLVDAQVSLKWRTETEIHNAGFEIERRAVNGSIDQWSKIGFVQGNGTSNVGHEYSFIDHDLPPGRYAYRLKQIDNDGIFKYYGGAEVEVLAPKEFSLSQNYPNPFNPSTTIGYQLPANSYVSLKVFDVLGREVAMLVNEEKSVGVYQATFDASNLPSGVYFYRLSANGFVETKRLLLLR